MEKVVRFWMDTDIDGMSSWHPRYAKGDSVTAVVKATQVMIAARPRRRGRAA